MSSKALISSILINLLISSLISTSVEEPGESNPNQVEVGEQSLGPIGSNGKSPAVSFEPTRKQARQEQPPPFHLAVWDDQGKICILAKIDASFTITYGTKYGDQQMIDRLTTDATVHGRCESFLDENPVMDIKWRGGFTFRLIFAKEIFENTWNFKTLELLYNTADSLFRDSVHGGQVLAKTKEGQLAQFETSLDRSYFCPAAPVLNLYNQEEKPVVVLRMFNVQIQAFKIRGGKFSPLQHCGQVGFGSGVTSPFLYGQSDDGIIVIVMSIYVFVSIMTVLGYAGYRTWFLRKPDYGTIA